jgi:ubiquinone/menaquinone biosynthesis C-methylase UbiE
MRTLLARFQKMADVPDYTRIALMYDRMMTHVDYAKWADYIHTLCEKFGTKTQKVIDGGCGTGSLSFHLSKMGYQIAGFDRSMEMIKVAYTKQCLPFWQGDLTALPLSKQWDAFLCIYDSIQYLSLEGIKKLFMEVRQILNTKGLVIFDVVTEKHVRKHWVDFYEKDRWKDWEMKRRSWYDTIDHIQHTEIEIAFLREKKVYREHHRQNIFPLYELESVIKDSGLKQLGKFRDYTLLPGNEKSDRVHFVLRQEKT